MDLQIRLAQQLYGFALPTSGPAEWRRTSDGWETRIELPEIPADHIIIPSFSSPDTDGSFQFTLCTPGESTLYPVPSPSDHCAMPDAESHDSTVGVTPHIDCWHSVRILHQATLVLRFRTPTKPQSYLLCISVRALQLEHVPLPDREATMSAPHAISQMQADAGIRQRICSPTALAMALGLVAPEQWQQAIEACHDPATKSYGAWPLAIRFAGQLDAFGSVESASNWDNALAVLDSGIPVVCSIRFTSGELTGAPLSATGGHLVCLYGVAQGKALVMDPAAADPPSVSRVYDIEQFARAWLTHRGAAYYLGAKSRR